MYWKCTNLRLCTVLVENFFYDNPDDLRFLESEEGRELVTKVIVEGVTEYLSTPTQQMLGQIFKHQDFDVKSLKNL